MRKNASFLVSALVAALLLAACGKGADKAKENAQRNAAVPVGFVQVQQRDVPVFLTGLGTVTAADTVVVRSRVDGEILRVNFREGQDVKQGQVLVELDPRPFEVQLQQAEAQLNRDMGQWNTAQENLKRAQILVNQGIYAQQQLDEQKAQTQQYEGTVQLDKAAIASARLNLTYAHVQAPVSGRIGIRNIDPGNIVHANDANGMLTITQMQPIAVLFTLPEDNLPQILDQMRKGTLDVELYSRDDKTKLSTGKLLTIDNQIDPTTGTVKLKAMFDNQDRMLWPNQFVNVRLQLETRKNATVLPAAAIQKGQQGQFVYVVGNDNTAQQRNVQVSLTQGNIVLIAGGVNPGERVVTDGQDKLQPGSKVDPHPAAGAPAQPGNTVANVGDGTTAQ